MAQNNFAQMLAQVAAEESGQSFRNVIRGFCRQMILDSIAEEVRQLCGRKHYPSATSAHRRAGSAPGSFCVEDEKVEVTRPRVRQIHEDGSEVEFTLKTYEAAQNTEGIEAKIVTAYLAGVSSRSITRLFPGAPGSSRGEVSRLWVERGAEYLKTLQTRDLGEKELVAVFLDGIVLGKDVVVLVALGVTADGEKKVIDFEQGSSESSEVCSALLARMEARNLRFAGRPLFVIDGSQALRKGIKAVHSRALIQRCLVHLERGVYPKNGTGRECMRLDTCERMAGNFLQKVPRTPQKLLCFLIGSGNAALCAAFPLSEFKSAKSM